MEKIFNIILKNNIIIKDIVTSEPSLEDLFNNLVEYLFNFPCNHGGH